MWWLIGVPVLAASLTLPEEAAVTAGPLEATPVECVATEPGWQRCELRGGWVRLVAGGSREELWIDPDWNVSLSEDGRVQGDGADAIDTQRELAAWVASESVGTMSDAARVAKKLRQRAAAMPVGPDLRARMVDHGLAEIATALVQSTETQALFEDATFYTRMNAVLQLRPEVAEDWRFWSFGWSYGRMCGGVKAYGIEKAVRRAAARTDAAGRHPTIAGAMAWGIESATTLEELEALDRAMAQWKTLGAPPAVLARYADRLARKRGAGPGKPAPRLSALDADGASHNLSEIQGPVVIDFWGSWCGPCIAAIPKMKALQTQWGSKITFLALASERGKGAAWRATVKKHEWSGGFVHWMHTDPELNVRWSIVKWPTYVVLDAEHKIVSFAFDAEDLESAIAAAVGG